MNRFKFLRSKGVGRIFAGWVGFLALISITSTPIRAQEYTFTGTLDSYFQVPTSIPELPLGQTFTVTLNYQGIQPGSQIGASPVYANAATNVTFTSGLYSITSPFADALGNELVAGNYVAAGIAGSAFNGPSLSSGQFPYYLQLTNGIAGGQLVLGFAGSVTPDVAFGASDVYGTITSVSVTPEPSTYALLFAGLGLVTFAVRQRGVQSSAPGRNRT